MEHREEAVAAVFEPVQAPTTFEETVDRLGTAIRLGLLAPGTRLPPERELADRLGISRSTLRQAITTLVQSGHLESVRGRGGGTFVTERPPLATRAPADPVGPWREMLDWRMAIETGAVALAAGRITAPAVRRLEALVERMDTSLDRFEDYRRADVRFHLGIAEATRAPRLVQAMTEVQGAMSEMIGHIAHPPKVLDRANRQHRQIVLTLARGDRARAVRLIMEHVGGTEHILAGLLPDAQVGSANL